MFQIPCKKQIETHFFIKYDVRYLGSRGMVSGPILAHSERILMVKNSFLSKKCKNGDPIWSSFSGVVFCAKSGLSGYQDGLKSSHLGSR